MTIASVIGLGTMGPGIGATLARGGLTVRLYDNNPAQVEKARDAVDMAKGVLDRLEFKPPPSGEGAVSFHRDLAEAVAGTQLIVESVPERIEIKAEVFRAIDPLAAPDAVIASNTSGIPITKLQSFVSNPGRFVGMHWSNPPHIIPMIEVIAGERTAGATVDWMVAAIRNLGLLPVVVKKDVAGFVENRILYALLRECVDLVERGVIEPKELDTCVSWGIGYKLSVIGPMALLDVAGLDIYQAVGSYLNRELSTRPDVGAYVTERTAKGRLGIKSGGGIFDYTPERIRELQAERARRLVAVRRALEGRGP
jgi:5-formyl-3-hydroxy-2-methylpyridine 4-carboxylate dehydrogenase